MMDQVKESKKTHLLTFMQSTMRIKATTALKSMSKSKMKSKNAIDDLILKLNILKNNSNTDLLNNNSLREITNSVLRNPEPIQNPNSVLQNPN